MITRLIRSVAGRPEPAAVMPAGVRVLRGAWLPALAGRLAGMRGPAAAVTLGDTIILHPDTRLSAGLLRHELAHVRQWRRSPLGFPLRYTWHHFRHGYAENPFEIEARAAETEVDRRRS